MPFERLVCTAISSEKSRENQEAKLRLPIPSWMELSSPMQTARTEEGKKTVPWNHNNNRMPWYINNKQTNVKPRTATKHETQGQADKGYQTRDTIHMAIRDIYKVRSTDVLDLSCCAAADLCARLASRVGGTFWRYWELAVLFWRYVELAVFFSQNR